MSSMTMESKSKVASQQRRKVSFHITSVSVHSCTSTLGNGSASNKYHQGASCLRSQRTRRRTTMMRTYNRHPSPFHADEDDHLVVDSLWSCSASKAANDKQLINRNKEVPNLSRANTDSDSDDDDDDDDYDAAEAAASAAFYASKQQSVRKLKISSIDEMSDHVSYSSCGSR